MKFSIITTSFFSLSIRSNTTTKDVRAKNKNHLSDPVIANAKYGKESFGCIVGGEDTNAGEFPFVVSWHENYDDYPSCSGSLVAPNLVLTAARCAGISGSVLIGRIGDKNLYSDSPKGVQAGIIRKIMHPKYNDTAIDTDILILELDQDIDTNIYTPIDLNFDYQETESDNMLTVLHFGALSSRGSQPDTLMKVDLPVNRRTICSSHIGNNEDIHLLADYPKGEMDSCQGNSGGPIFKYINGVTTQVGVVSFDQGCARPGHSDTYARLSGVSSWLKAEICKRSNDPKPLYCEKFRPPPMSLLPTPTPVYRPISDYAGSFPDWNESNEPEYDCKAFAQDGDCATYIWKWVR